VRDLLEHPNLQSEVKECKEAYHDSTPQGKVDRVAKKYKDWKILINRFDVSRTATLAGLVEQYFEEYQQSANELTRQFAKQFDTKLSVMIFRTKEYDMTPCGEKTNNFIVQANGYIFVFTTLKKNFMLLRQE